MRPSPYDPTAGERARIIREHPEITPVILDPTDPRYGTVPDPAYPDAVVVQEPDDTTLSR